MLYEGRSESAVLMLYVAAYCRVSTDKDDQANSFESQKLYFEQYIKRNPDWELYEIYADEGLTGTTTKKRKAFNKMIADAHLKKFDLIITKEVSRFARNTVDTLQYTRELKSLNIGVLFLLDNIDTLAPDGELRLTIMASLAQEESRKTSERVKWGQKRQMEKGVVFGRSMLGYDVVNGTMRINEQGAEIVRLIFHKFAYEKKGACLIAKELREAGYKTLTGNTMWTNTVILRILRNEKYCGDLIQKKTITPDFLTHQKKYNHGEEDFVVIRDHHEPIISRDVWDLTQYELDSRSPTEEIKARHSNRYPLSGKIKCGCCKNSFVSRTKKRKDGSQYKAWKCYEAAQHGLPKIDSAGNQIGCSVNCQIRDEIFMLAIQKTVENLKANKKKVLDDVIGALKIVFAAGRSKPLNEETIKRKIENAESKSKKLLDLYLNEDLTKEQYRQKKESLEKEIAELKKALSNIDKASYDAYDSQQVIEDIKKYLSDLLYSKKQDDVFYKTIIDRIVVIDKKHFDIYLNLLPIRWKTALYSTLMQNSSNGDINETMYPHPLQTAYFDENAVKLAEIQVFEHCFRHGTSLDYKRKYRSTEPEITLTVKL